MVAFFCPLYMDLQDLTSSAQTGCIQTGAKQM